MVISKHASSFGGGSDGATPMGPLVVDNNGELYGTSAWGGSKAPGKGTVFRLTLSPSGSYTESILYRFGGYPNDGEHPSAGLMVDKADVLYGTTAWGGTYMTGMVFKLAPAASGYTESVLYSFQGACARASRAGQRQPMQNNRAYL